MTVLLETPVLLVGLSSIHSIRRRLFAGFWLTACTYPIVVLVLPFLFWEPFGRVPYLVVAETFAPLAECLLFYTAFLSGTQARASTVVRDMLSIVGANLVSFLTHEIYQYLLSR